LDTTRIKYLIFDFDGTLGDSYTPITESFNVVIRHFGGNPVSEADVRPWVGLGLEAGLRHFLGEDKADEALTRFREHYLKIYREGSRLIDGVLGVLRALEGHYRMAICSNKPGETLRSLCDHLEISGYFEALLGAYDVPRLKPAPDMLMEALKTLGATKDDSLYVGDTLVDVEFADACGVPYVLVLGGTGTEEELRATSAVRLLSNIRELPGLLGMP
jgi:phosphoglycolate phosphatase